MKLRLPCSTLFAALMASALLLVAPWAEARSQCAPPFTAPTSAQIEAATQNAPDRGFLWRIEKDGRVSHLYGTLHVGKLAWVAPGPHVASAIADSQVVAMELDVSDEAVQRELAAGATASAPALPPKLRERMRRQAETECISPAELQGMRPEFQLALITVMTARRDGLEAPYGSEMVLAGTASQLGKAVHGLETVEEQLAALREDDPAKLAELIDQGLSDLASGKARKVLKQLATAWEHSDAERLQNYEQWCECVDTPAERAMAERMITRRNHVLAERIDALHGQRGPAFVAVGALHMFGPQGLPALLAARGYSVKRIV